MKWDLKCCLKWIMKITKECKVLILKFIKRASLPRTHYDYDILGIHEMI